MTGPRTPLVLLPGLLCDAALWSHQIEMLADLADITVAELTHDRSFPAMAERVLAAAPPKFALAGLSMGGYLAHEIMRQAPERVLKLALLDTSARPDTEEQRQRRHALIDLATRGKFKGVTPRLLPLFLHPDRLSDEALTGAVMGMAERIGRDAFLNQQHAILARPDSRQQLSGYKVPTLVLCGRQDALTPLEVSIEMASAIPGADLVVLGDCGHLSTMERPESTSAHLRAWLER